MLRKISYNIYCKQTTVCRSIFLFVLKDVFNFKKEKITSTVMYLVDLVFLENHITDSNKLGFERKTPKHLGNVLSFVVYIKSIKVD